MPDSAIVVSQPRHLSLPDEAFFAPTELHISPNCSRSDFERIVRAVTALDTAGDLWVADAALYSHQTWGQAGLELTAKASGFSYAHLKKSAWVAEAFTPEHRFTCYTFAHYRIMMAFPREWAYKFMADNAGKKLSYNGLRAVAEKEFGGNPTKAKQRKLRAVQIPAELYERLRPFSDSRKIAVHITNILEVWIKSHQASAVIPKAEPESVKEEESVIITPEPVVNAEPETRPTYAERRQAQLDDGAQRIQPKEKKQTLWPKIKFAWTECSPLQVIDGENGVTLLRASSGSNPTKFRDLESAQKAEAEHFAARGYHEQVKKCDVCSGGNARHEVFHIYHIFTSEGEKQ